MAHSSLSFSHAEGLQCYGCTQPCVRGRQSRSPVHLATGFSTSPPFSTGLLFLQWFKEIIWVASDEVLTLHLTCFNLHTFPSCFTECCCSNIDYTLIIVFIRAILKTGTHKRNRQFKLLKILFVLCTTRINLHIYSFILWDLTLGIVLPTVNYNQSRAVTSCISFQSIYTGVEVLWSTWIITYVVLRNLPQMSSCGTIQEKYPCTAGL